MNLQFFADGGDGGDGAGGGGAKEGSGGDGERDLLYPLTTS